ncbi:hypothetical protein Pelo_18939 [Pelomyxa schiedti]|nr:hypothetical protein Pelo_18939 [Pelomyxa schiedti]
MAVGAIANLAMQYDIREVFNCVSELKECVADIYIKKSWMDVLFFIDLMLWQLTVGSKELKPMPPEEQERLKNAIQHIYSESRKVGILHSEELREDADAAKKEEATAAEPPSTSSESAKHGVIMGALAKAGNKVKETILTTAHTLKRKASEITSQLNAIIEGEHDFSLGYVNLLDNVIKAEPLLDNIDMKNWALDQLKGILVGEDYRESTLMKFFNSEVGLMMVVISKLREYSTMPPPIGNTAWQILVDVMAFIHVEEAKTQANRDIKNGINFGLARYSQRRKFDKVSSALKRPTLVYISDEEQWLYVVPKATGAPPDYTYVLRLHSPPSPKEQPPTEVISCFDDKLNKSETVYSAHAKGILNPVKLNFLFFMKTHPVPPTPPASGAFANIHPIFQFKMLIPPTKPQTVGVEDTLCTSELFMKAKAEVLATLKDSVDDQVMDLRKRTLEDPQLESLLKTYVESDCRETVLDKVAQPLKETLFKKFLNLEPPAMSQSHRHHSGRRNWKINIRALCGETPVGVV